MGKILKINEKQYQAILESINKGVLVEDDNERVFSVRVPIEFYNPRTINGKRVSIEGPKEIDLTFQVSIYYKKWGIDDIQIYNIKGPKHLVLELDIEPDDDSDEAWDANEIIEHTIHVDWENETKIKLVSPDERPNIETTIEEIEMELDEALFVQKITIVKR